MINMAYTTPFKKEPIRMSDFTEEYVEKHAKYKSKLKWKKRDWNYVSRRKKFNVYRYQSGRNVKYRLAFKEPSFLWDKVGRPGRSSWEVAKLGNYMYFRMLIDGSIETNTIKQKIE